MRFESNRTEKTIEEKDEETIEAGSCSACVGYRAMSELTFLYLPSLLCTVKLSGISGDTAVGVTHSGEVCPHWMNS